MPDDEMLTFDKEVTDPGFIGRGVKASRAIEVRVLQSLVHRADFIVVDAREDELFSSEFADSGSNGFQVRMGV